MEVSPKTKLRTPICPNQRTMEELVPHVDCSTIHISWVMETSCLTTEEGTKRLRTFSLCHKEYISIMCRERDAHSNEAVPNISYCLHELRQSPKDKYASSHLWFLDAIQVIKLCKYIWNRQLCRGTKRTKERGGKKMRIWSTFYICVKSYGTRYQVLSINTMHFLI